MVIVTDPPSGAVFALHADLTVYLTGLEPVLPAGVPARAHPH